MNDERHRGAVNGRHRGPVNERHRGPVNGRHRGPVNGRHRQARLVVAHDGEARHLDACADPRGARRHREDLQGALRARGAERFDSQRASSREHGRSRRCANRRGRPSRGACCTPRVRHRMVRPVLGAARGRTAASGRAGHEADAPREGTPSTGRARSGWTLRDPTVRALESTARPSRGGHLPPTPLARSRVSSSPHAEADPCCEDPRRR